MNKTKILKGIFVFIFWMTIWYIVSLLINQELLFPSPIIVIERIFILVKTSGFWQSIFSTLLRILFALVIGVFAGLLFAILSSIFEFIKELIEPLIRIIRSMPVTSFIILLLLYFSYSITPVVVGALMVLPIVYENVVQGVKECDKKLLEFGKAYRLSKKQMLTYIYIPSIKPYFYSSLITSIGLSWKATVASEVICQPINAIGTNIYLSKIYLETVDLFAYSFVVVILSYVLEKVISHFLKELKDENN